MGIRLIDFNTKNITITVLYNDKETNDMILFNKTLFDDQKAAGLKKFINIEQLKLQAPDYVHLFWRNYTF
jgi:hypothetical protein